MSQEVNTQRDIELWKSLNGLTEDQRLIVKRNLTTAPPDHCPAFVAGVSYCE
jgi:hypothetical protein